MVILCSGKRDTYKRNKNSLQKYKHIILFYNDGIAKKIIILTLGHVKRNIKR